MASLVTLPLCGGMVQPPVRRPSRRVRSASRRRRRRPVTPARRPRWRSVRWPPARPSPHRPPGPVSTSLSLFAFVCPHFCKMHKLISEINQWNEWAECWHKNWLIFFDFGIFFSFTCFIFIRLSYVFDSTVALDHECRGFLRRSFSTYVEFWRSWVL